MRVQDGTTITYTFERKVEDILFRRVLELGLDIGSQNPRSRPSDFVSREYREVHCPPGQRSCGLRDPQPLPQLFVCHSARSALARGPAIACAAWPGMAITLAAQAASTRSPSNARTRRPAPLRLIHPQGLQPGHVAGSQRQGTAHAPLCSAHRRRARGCRGWANRPRFYPARRSPNPGRRHAAPDRSRPHADPLADRRRQARQNR